MVYKRMKRHDFWVYVLHTRNFGFWQEMKFNLSTISFQQINFAWARQLPFIFKFIFFKPIFLIDVNDDYFLIALLLNSVDNFQKYMRAWAVSK